MKKLVYGLGDNDSQFKPMPVKMPGNVCDSPYYRVWKSLIRRCKDMKAKSVEKDLRSFSAFTHWAVKLNYDENIHSMAIGCNTTGVIGLSHVIMIPRDKQTSLKIPPATNGLPPWVNKGYGNLSKKFYYSVTKPGSSSRVCYYSSTKIETQCGALLNRAKGLREIADMCVCDASAKLHVMADAYEKLAAKGGTFGVTAIEAAINEELIKHGEYQC